MLALDLAKENQGNLISMFSGFRTFLKGPFSRHLPECRQEVANPGNFHIFLNRFHDLGFINRRIIQQYHRFDIPETE